MPLFAASCASLGRSKMPPRPSVFLRNLACRLESKCRGVSKSILEELDKIVTVTRLGLPLELRRWLATTNNIESMNAVIRQVCGNVKRSRDAQIALRWTAAGRV
jgi:transposase-like protein